MQINISETEYRLLMDMLYLSDWMMNSHDETGNANPEYRALRKKILAYSKDAGAEDKVKFSKEDDEYYELAEYEDMLQEKFIDEYDNETFWEELIDRLSNRDLMSEMSAKEITNMEFSERIERLSKFEEKYESEFEHNGLNNLKINKKR